MSLQEAPGGFLRLTLDELKPYSLVVCSMADAQVGESLEGSGDCGHSHVDALSFPLHCLSPEGNGKISAFKDPHGSGGNNGDSIITWELERQDFFYEFFALLNRHVVWLGEQENSNGLFASSVRRASRGRTANYAEDSCRQRGRAIAKLRWKDDG
ncbi:hypothetical protein VTK56DRAFT_9352 [Thermocarpiscus australiensis]